MSEASLNVVAPIYSDVFERVFSEIESVNWFTNSGLQSIEEVQPYAYQYLCGLGFSTRLVHIEADARKLEDYIKYRFDTDWIDAESATHQKLVDSVRRTNYGEALDHLVKQIASSLSSRVLLSAENQLAGSDKYLARVAAGSATETCFRYALESISSPDASNVFASKFEIFRLGRWPLCISNDKFIIH